MPEEAIPGDLGFAEYSEGFCSPRAPGVWKSTGSVTDGCYWARLDENQEIIDNHYGAAGGSVKLRSSDFEFETEDCGGWVYEG